MTRALLTWTAIAAFACVATPTSGRAQAPTKAPAQIQPPPAAPAPLAAKPALIPPDSAVALCMDGFFVRAPGTVADCAKHNGLRVAMPPHGVRSILRKETPSFNVRAAVTPAPPAGATMHCKDGTYLTGAVAASRCANNGGLAAILPQAPPLTPPPQKRP